MRKRFTVKMLLEKMGAVLNLSCHEFEKKRQQQKLFPQNIAPFNVSVRITAELVSSQKHNI